MDEEQADAVAAAMGGETWNSGGGTYLVILHRSDGKVVAISTEAVCVYTDEDAMQTDKPVESVLLRSSMPEIIDGIDAFVEETDRAAAGQVRRCQ